MLFTDDFQVYLQCKRADITTVAEKLSIDAENVAVWTDRNDLQLNFSKIVAIIFGSAQMMMRIDTSSLPRIVIRGHQVEFVSAVKNLSVTLTSNLSWNTHVSSIISRVHGDLKK